MIVLSNTEAQTLTPGQAIVFDTVPFHSGNGECHRSNSSSVKMRANGCYEISFSANVAATAANAVQLSIQVGGETLPETTRISTPTAADSFNPVAMETEVRNCCGDYDRVTVVNTGTTDIIVGAGSALRVARNA